MKINMETKFEVGQEVFLIKKERKVIENRKKCEICSGVGHVFFKGYTMCCPECGGSKSIWVDSNIVDEYYFTDKKPHTITSIGIKITTKGSRLTYTIDGNLYERKKVSEDELFATQEEAEAKCRELNGGRAK